MAAPLPPRTQSTRRTHFVRRLSLYLLGIAIGFLFLGLVQSFKRAQAARKASESQRQTADQPASDAPGVTTRLARDPPSDP